MLKKLLILLFVIPSTWIITSCEVPPECTDFEIAVQTLYDEIYDIPELNNPALFVHLEKAAVAGLEGDEATAAKELAKFMNIGSQPKYVDIYQLFLDVENLFWDCLEVYTD